MNCHECQELLQRRLDGEAVADSPDFEHHLTACRACHEQNAAALRFAEGVKHLRRPSCPPQLRARIVAAVLEDRRSRRQRLRVRALVTTALAASLLLMAGAGYLFLPRPNATDDKPGPAIGRNDKNENKDAKVEPAPELAKSMDDARNALVSLTERVADQTKQQAKILLAAGNPVDIAAIPNGPAVPENFDPTEPFRQAGQGLSEGLEPVTRSTRRALQFLMREVGGAGASAQ